MAAPAPPTVGWVVGIFQQGAASMERINVILNTKPDISDDEDTKSVKEITGDIEVKDLTFAYSDNQEPVLKNI